MSVEVKTGYFAQINKYVKAGYVPIAITASNPNWYKGSSMPALAPEWELVSDWKNHRITWDEYKERYISMLERRGIGYALKMLDQFEKVILLCYEKTGDNCHRHLLAEYLNSKYNMNVLEFEI